MDPLQGEVWRTVEALNRCWTAGNPTDLRDYFHEHMVAITPGDRAPLHGREACVSAWADYARSTTILSWSALERTIQVYGDVAVVTYLYEMECERDGRRFHPSGRDMMVLAREGDRWWVVADQFSPYPEGGDL